MNKKQRIRDATFVTESKSIGHVQSIVENSWYSKWLPLVDRNDDGIDAAILLYKKHTIVVGDRRVHDRKSTGDVLFIQVKGGEGYLRKSKKRPGCICINVGREYISSHRPKWNNLPGAALLVYVDTHSHPRRLRAWWVDLRAESTYDQDNRGLILIPRSQTFGVHSKGFIRALSLIQSPVGKEYELAIPRGVANSVPLTGAVKASCRKIYREWAAAPPAERTHAKLGEVLVSRVGWRHLTRKGRRPERIVASLQLIAVARLAIGHPIQHSTLGRTEVKIMPDGSFERNDYVGLRFCAIFQHRRPAVIQIVLKRKRRYDSSKQRIEQKVWFLSVYEKIKRPSLPVQDSSKTE